VSAAYRLSWLQFYLRSKPITPTELITLFFYGHSSILCYCFYRRSLLDILTETSAIAKCYTLIGMIPVLRSEEIHSLSETLPPECAFLRKKGLVHLLPSPFREMLDDDRNQRESSPRRGGLNYAENRVANENDTDLSSYHSFFSVPQRAQVASNPATSSTSTPPISRNIIVSTYPDVRSVRSVISHQIRGGGNVVRQGTRLNTNFGRCSLPQLHLPTRQGVSGLTIPQGDFERTLEQMIARRTEVTTDWVVQKISSAVTSTVYRIASGGHMSDKFMIGMIGACSAGAGIASVAYGALQASTSNHEIVVRGSGSITAAQKVTYVLQLALRNAAMCATPCLGTVAIATGSMFAIRKVSNVSLTAFSHLRIREILARSRNFLWRLQDSPLKCFSLGKFFNLNDPTFLIVVSAWTLTAFLALQLKVRTKNFQWMFNIILAKLLRCYEDLFNLDENCNA
jgi:hypothetical protein